MESKSERKIKFEQWLGDSLGGQSFQALAMPGDASLRSYYRIVTPVSSYVAMDAPPPENCRPFVAVAAALQVMGLLAPEVIAQNLDMGFLLLTDFGDTTYLKSFHQQPGIAHANDLYGRALRALAMMQACRSVPGHELKPFGREWMEREWAWHQEWFLEKWLGVALPSGGALDACYEQLIISALEQPQVFMHRDYHAANLMVAAENKVGILDFQDAFIGPLTYDPASLLRDCYVDWPQENVRAWAIGYANILREQGLLTGISDQTFMRWFDFMGLQRHIKALLTFARKYVRDQQPRYLEFVPRTLNYIVEVSRQYPELQPITEFYTNVTELASQKAKTICVP
jgi:aminoglycoside/choline kinase family phosphotransferase